MNPKFDQLLTHALQGNEKAQEDLFVALRPLILSSIRKYHYRSEQFDDLEQLGLIAVYECLQSFDPNRGVHFLGYVKSQLRYLYLEMNRERVCLSLDQPGPDGLAPIDLLEDEVNIEEDFLVRQDHLELSSAMSALTPTERQIILDYYYRGHSMKQIASDRGTSYRTVVNNKKRALNKLKDHLRNKI